MENDKKRQFTLRLTDEENEKVEELKEFLGLNTDSSVIRYLISHYKKLKMEFDEKEKLCNRLNSNIKNMIDTVQTYFEAEKNFKKMFGKK